MPEISAEEGNEIFAVELDIDFVRSAPQRVELPVPGGTVLVAEMTVFEDRGNGDAMWAGRLPGVPYDSVLLTVKDGHLAGRFGEPGGARYLIGVGPDGRGQMSDESLSPFNVESHDCPAGLVTPPELSGEPLPARSARGQHVGVSESNHDVLDVLVVYTAESAERWSRRNLTPGPAIQRSMDYLQMVFRNGQIGVTPNLVHYEEAPALYGEHEEGEDSQWSCGHVLGHMPADPDLRALRAEHEADVVHLFVWGLDGCSGIAYLLQNGGTAQSFSGAAFGLTLPRGDYDSTFAHEIGHNMGANHDPSNAGNDIDPVYPYAFGHTDFVPLPNIDTIMSYGSGRVEPYFSTVRISPRGWTLGIANERENERAMQQTIDLVVQYSDYLPDSNTEPPPPDPGQPPAMPSNLSAVPTGPFSARLTWTDESDNENGFTVRYRGETGGWKNGPDLVENTTSAEVRGLEAGGRYAFQVRAFNQAGSADSGTAEAVLPEAEYSDCVPSQTLHTFEIGYTVSMCFEDTSDRDEEGRPKQKDALNFGLESKDSAILYFFKRDNAELLIKVLDTCVISPNRWVFAAPVTDLAFNLQVTEAGTGRTWTHRNPRGGVTAAAVSDTAAFSCAESAGAPVAGAGAPGLELVKAGFGRLSSAVSWPTASSQTVAAKPDLAGLGTSSVPVMPPVARRAAECDPLPVVTLKGGYVVKMCAETQKGDLTEVFQVKDFGLDSDQSALLYFFQKDNAELLIKVLDTCAFSPNRWVFVAPVTDLGYNLVIEAPDGRVWTRTNSLGQTAVPAQDNRAFACAE